MTNDSERRKAAQKLRELEIGLIGTMARQWAGELAERGQ